jgi:glycosyltransferase involved in cell wall biosynthesis
LADHNAPNPPTRRDLEQLWLENQYLYSRLRRFRETPFLLHGAVRALVRDATAHVPGLRRQSAPAPRPDPANFPESFRPYEVRQIRPSRHSRPRVLHVIGNFYTGGSPRLVVDLIEHLGDRYEQVTLVRTAPPQSHYVGLEVRAEPELASERAALKLLRRLRPDLLHVHFLGHHEDRYGQADWNWYDVIFRAAREYGRPVVENVNIPIVPYFSDVVRCYVFVSDYVRRLFARESDRNVTIYPGSNLTLFSRSPDAPPPDSCIGMAYRLERDKLDESAIEVFIEAVRQRPETRVIIVGGGRFLELYRARADEAGLGHAFSFPAFVTYDDLPRLYEQISVFVAPPHTESFGHVVPLAMGMQIPVAAYSVGALPEILDDENVLAPPGDVKALATRIVDLLDDRDRRLRIGAANRERAQRLFSVERMVGDYRVLYEELLR